MGFWARIKSGASRARAQKERDLEREIRSHLDLEAEESGRYGAQRAFGNATLVKEDVRAAWGWTRLEQVARDVRYGLRQVRRNPAFSAIAIATLALGIGVNTAMFSAVDAVLIRPLPYADADRLVMVWDDDQSRTGSRSSSPRRRNGMSGGATTRCSRTSRQASLEMRRSPATASPKSCRPAKSPPISGPCWARNRCSDASSRKTKTRAACASSSSAMGSGSGASAGRPTWWAARSR